MPFVLDYDSTGKAVGGHIVAELDHNQLCSAPNFPSQSDGLNEPLDPHQTLSGPIIGAPHHHKFVSNPPNHPPHQQPVFAQIYRARRRSLSPAQTDKADAFLAMFIKHFRNDANTMMAFEALFTDYNKRAINETGFYVGIFLLLSRTHSDDLLPALVEVLPVSWQITDVSWLHEAAEARHEAMARARGSSSSSLKTSANDLSDKDDCNLADALKYGASDAAAHVSQDDLEHVSPLRKDARSPPKRGNRAPSKGFRTSHTSESAQLQPLYVDPAALMIHKPIIEAVSDSDEEMQEMKTQNKPGSKGLITLKYKTTEPASSRRKPQKLSVKPRTAKGKSLKKTTELAHMTEEIVATSGPVTDSGRAVNAPSAQAKPLRKGNVRYGEFYAAEIKHFGHFPTRRAVIARSSRPYVHLCCGKGFTHPSDVKEHHRNRGRTAGGCPGKNGVPQGDDDEWNAHPSARIEYPDINYTKVRDGYIILDQASRDKIDSAIAAGMEYLATREIFETAE